MQHILLTGATGFLGSHLLDALLQQGIQVTLLKRSTSNLARIEHQLSQVRAIDIDRKPLEQAFNDQPVDAVIHTACNYGRQGQATHEVVQTNLLFSLQLLDAAIDHGVTTFFNTDTLLPRHLTPYALSKKQFVEWLELRSQQIRGVNLRLEHMYGPGDDDTKFVPWLIGQLQQHVPRIALTEGSQLRDFIYINDVVSAYMTLVQQAADLPSFSEFDVGTGQLTSVRDFVTALQHAYRQQAPDSATVLGFGDRPLREGELSAVEVDNSALTALGWRAHYTVEQGIGQLFGI